jgi:hypothetical protein
VVSTDKEAKTNWEQFFFQHRILSAGKSLLAIGHIVLRGLWFNIIVVKVHVTTEYSKDSICEELEQVFDRIITSHMKNLVGGCYANLGREGVFKPATLA